MEDLDWFAAEDQQARCHVEYAKAQARRCNAST